MHTWWGKVLLKNTQSGLLGYRRAFKAPRYSANNLLAQKPEDSSKNSSLTFFSQAAWPRSRPDLSHVTHLFTWPVSMVLITVFRAPNRIQCNLLHTDSSHLKDSLVGRHPYLPWLVVHADRGRPWPRLPSYCLSVVPGSTVNPTG